LRRYRPAEADVLSARISRLEKLMAHRPTILLVEDEALIAFAMRADLELDGFAVAGPFARSCDAEEWLMAARPDCAVLDIQLSDDDCTAALAEALVRSSVPVIVHSAFQREMSPVQIAATVWLEKPATRTAIASAICAVTQGSPR
jgi:DNA-binding response OmpR family regulator